KEMEEETNIVRITLCVDSDGMICEITTDISVEPARFGRIEEGILQTGLFDADSYGEQIIRNGSPCHEDMVWDFETYFRRFMYPDEVYEQENEGLLKSGYVCTSAESVADIFLHVLGNRGADVEKYEEWFKYDKYFSNFADADWESLGEDWIVDEEYDCFFIDRISIGWAGFQIYFYPDFQSMEVDTAKAVVIDCNVGISDGLIGYIDIDFFPVTEEEYQAVRQKQAESRILLVEKGNVLSGTTEITIPVLDRKVEYMPISEFDTDSAAVEHSSRKVKEEVWGFTDAAEIADYIGQKFLKDFDEDNADKGEIYELLKDKDERYSVPYSTYYYIEDGWKADNKYDCYYVKSNEAEGCMHLQYYFYPEQDAGEQTGKTLVFNVYLSEGGIEDIEVSQFWIDYAIAKGCCSMEDLGEMDYYLFCHTDLSKGATGLEAKPSIISNDTQTIEEAKELYQKFKEQLPLEDDSDEDERTEVLYISPDCKWVTTEKWSEFQLVNTVTLFFQKEKVKEKTGRNTEGLAEILIVKDGDAYKEADEQYYKRLSELEKEMEGEGYFILMKINSEGDLIAGIKDNFSLLTIRRIEDGAELWSFDLQGMQEKVKKIRDDIREEDMSMVFVKHFRGSEQEGWLVIQVGPSSFFRIDYPSGEVTYLGEYLYSPSFSPDGKYMAYSSIDGDNVIDMDPAEYEQTPSPGIYVREVETGKTAYIYWYPSRETGEDYMESRGFQWLEKEAFEEFMGGENSD
ncbi:MAG: hypothetical protein K2J04_05660, partial [Lachnospiraceae bacterium]|nr:hypothetical protein [Lachnospiraceae bacterium]